jgi:hypothetical protein
VRRSSAFLLYVGVNLVLAGALVVHASHRRAVLEADLRGAAALAGTIGLTDICLTTEANYTRHPSQADYHTPFLDGPFGFDHFPSGAVIGPPAHLGKRHETSDRAAAQHP